MKMNKSEIIAVGHDENALIFNAIGIKGHVCHNEDELINLINDQLKDVKIFIVSDHFKDEIQKLRKTFKSVYPIFLLLPLDGSSNKDGIESLRKDVERATGISLI